MRALPSIFIVMYLTTTKHLVHHKMLCLARATPTFISIRHQVRRNINQIRSRHLSSTSIIEDQQHIRHERSNGSNKEVEARISDLLTHPAVLWNSNSTFTSMHKKKLAKRHLTLFDRSHESSCDVLFDQFATAVCNAGVVARKEVFETWASALYIHNFFFNKHNNNRGLRRVADIAAGHGLLAWALLILDYEWRKLQSEELPPLTAFCLDVQMPKSAERVQASMIEQFPHLEKQFDYVEGRLEQLIPHQSCLLAGVHACGTLSDVLVSTAADWGVSLALVPCCHSRKVKLLQACASPYAKEQYDAILSTKGKMPDLADRLDAARIVALKNSGMRVEETSIPELFTEKNLLIMATPKTIDQESRMIRSGQMPPINAIQDEATSAMINSKARFMKGFCVPCKDDEAHRQLISDIAGRLAATKRKQVMHNRNHEENPRLDVSMWLPTDGSNIIEHSLSGLIKSKHPDIICSVSKLGDVYIDPKTTRRAQTFRIQYGVEDGIISFDYANKVHQALYQDIPVVFPGAQCR